MSNSGATLNLLDSVGSGGFATVKLGNYSRPNSPAIPVAVKILQDGQYAESFPAEFDIMGRLRHEFLMSAIDIVRINPSQVAIVMPLSRDGAMPVWWLRQNLTVVERLRLFYQTLSGVSHLHQNGYLHLDLKPDNIILMRKDTGELYPSVSDFSLSLYLPRDLESLEINDPVITTTWRPPELFEKKMVVSRLSDSWSLGIILFDLLIGQFSAFLPVSSYSDDDMRKAFAALSGDLEQRIDYWIGETTSSLPREQVEMLKDLAIHLLHFNANPSDPRDQRRWTPLEALDHPLFQSLGFQPGVAKFGEMYEPNFSNKNRVDITNSISKLLLKYWIEMKHLPWGNATFDNLLTSQLLFNRIALEKDFTIPQLILLRIAALQIAIEINMGGFPANLDPVDYCGSVLSALGVDSRYCYEEYPELYWHIILSSGGILRSSRFESVIFLLSQGSRRDLSKYLTDCYLVMDDAMCLQSTVRNSSDYHSETTLNITQSTLIRDLKQVFNFPV